MMVVVVVGQPRITDSWSGGWLPPGHSPHPWRLNINNRHFLGDLHHLHGSSVQQHLLYVVLAVPRTACGGQSPVSILSSPDGQLQRRHVLVVDLVDVCSPLQQDLDDLLPATADSIVEWCGVPGTNQPQFS